MDLNLTGYWTAGRSRVVYERRAETLVTDMQTGVASSYPDTARFRTRGVMDDIGIVGDLDWLPSPVHHLRFGGTYVRHAWRPAYERDGRTTQERNAAVRLRLGPRVDVKLSYSEMSQFSRKLATNWLDLPTDLWMPSGNRVPPMRSRQFAGGVYIAPTARFHLNVEGWWKAMDNLVEYKGRSAYLPGIRDWEADFALGRGRSCGVEVDGGYETEKLGLDAFYTLSWNQRYFEEIWPGWYPDRNDNRHKLTLVAHWRPNWKWECYAAWNFHSGNRLTVPTQYIPDIHGADGRHPAWVYEEPNNARLPDYHRLDVGVDLHRRTRKGREAVWNFSIYNVYCRRNLILGVTDLPVAGDSSLLPSDFGFKASGQGLLVPILPSFSYTCKF